MFSSCFTPTSGTKDLAFLITAIHHRAEATLNCRERNLCSGKVLVAFPRTFSLSLIVSLRPPLSMSEALASVKVSRGLLSSR